LIHPDAAAAIRPLFEEAVGEPDGTPTAGFGAGRQDGSRRWPEIAARHRLEDPAVAGVVVDASDVTERRLAKGAQGEERRQATPGGANGDGAGEGVGAMAIHRSPFAGPAGGEEGGQRPLLQPPTAFGSAASAVRVGATSSGTGFGTGPGTAAGSGDPASR